MTDKFLSSLTTAAILLSSAVSAHGYVQGIIADSVFYQGYRPSYQYLSQQPILAAWSDPKNLDNGYVNNYSSPDIICNVGATPGQTYATVQAGGTVELQWTPWPVGHLGPVISYLANCNGECTNVDKTQLLFNKINAAGLLPSGSANKWAAGELAANNNSWTLQIPSEIAPGNYVLRHEIISLQEAMAKGHAQNYPMCINLKVTGSGSNSLQSGTLGTALYQSSDPGLYIDIYSGLTNYTIPGPPLLAGSPNAPNPQPTNLQSATATATVSFAGASSTATATTTSRRTATSSLSSSVTTTSSLTTILTSTISSTFTSSTTTPSVTSSTSIVTSTTSSVTSTTPSVTSTITSTTLSTSTTTTNTVQSGSSSTSTTTSVLSTSSSTLTTTMSSLSAVTITVTDTVTAGGSTASTSMTTSSSTPSMSNSTTTSNSMTTTSSPTTFSTLTITNSTVTVMNSTTSSNTSIPTDLTSTSTDLVTLTVTVPGIFAVPSTLSTSSSFPTMTPTGGFYYPMNNGTSSNGTAYSTGTAYSSGTAWSTGSWSAWTTSSPTSTGTSTGTDYVWSSDSTQTPSPTIDNGYTGKRSMRIVRRNSQRWW